MFRVGSHLAVEDRGGDWFALRGGSLTWLLIKKDQTAELARRLAAGEVEGTFADISTGRKDDWIYLQVGKSEPSYVAFAEVHQVGHQLLALLNEKPQLAIAAE